LLVSNQTANLLDADQMEEIEANAAEALTNVTKLFQAKGLLEIIHNMGVQPFVLMCGSKNTQVLRHSPLVIGNIAQIDEQREGMKTDPLGVQCRFSSSMPELIGSRIFLS